MMIWLVAPIGNVSAVAKAFGCTEYVVRGAIDDDVAARQRQSNRQSARRNRAKARLPHRVEEEVVDYAPLYDPRRDGYPEYTDAQSELFALSSVPRTEF